MRKSMLTFALLASTCLHSVYAQQVTVGQRAGQARDAAAALAAESSALAAAQYAQQLVTTAISKVQALAGQSNTNDIPVFIGGTLNLSNLANGPLIAPLLATGKVGLYQHAVGMGALGAPAVGALLGAWGLGNGGGHGVCETGAIANYDPAVIGDYLALFGINRKYPNACVMNLPGTQTGTGTYVAPAGSVVPGKSYTQFVTASDLATAKAAISLAMTHGANQIAINDTPNSYSMDLDNPFATSGFWANVRALYAFGGGGALDVPPSYFVNREPAYQQNIIQQIQWMNSQGLASYVLLSPFLYAGTDAAGNTYNSAYDPMFFEHLVQMYVTLKQANALPTHWIIENYATPNATPAATSNALDNTQEGLVTAALWLAGVGKVSKAGLTPAGANGATDAGQQVSTHNALVADPVAAHTGGLTLADVADAGTLAGMDSDFAVINGNSQISINGIGQMGGLNLTGTFGIALPPSGSAANSPSASITLTAVSAGGPLVTTKITSDGNSFINVPNLSVAGSTVLHGYTQAGPLSSAAGSNSFPFQFLAVGASGSIVFSQISGDANGNVDVPNLALLNCPVADPHVANGMWCNHGVYTMSGTGSLDVTTLATQTALTSEASTARAAETAAQTTANAAAPQTALTTEISRAMAAELLKATVTALSSEASTARAAEALLAPLASPQFTGTAVVVGQSGTLAITGPRTGDQLSAISVPGGLGIFAPGGFNSYGPGGYGAAGSYGAFTMTPPGYTNGPVQFALYNSAGGYNFGASQVLTNGMMVGTAGLLSGATTVGSLPACNASMEGLRMGVKDATAPTFLGTLTGGGTVHSPAYCNGTNWVAG